MPVFKMERPFPIMGCLHYPSSSALMKAMSQNTSSSRSAAGDLSAGGHTHLPASWQDWITSNVLRGCDRASMQAIMVENGFDPVFATHAVAIIGGIGERIKDIPGQDREAILQGQQGQYQASPSRLVSQLPRFTVADREIELVVVMSNPNIAVIRGLLSDTECDEIIRLSQGKMKTSLVVDRDSGDSYESSVRKSEGSHFERGENALVERIEARLAALLNLPVNRGEPLQILHYGVGGEYQAHQDFFEPSDPGSAVLTRVGGQRIGTVVMYLNDVPEGGETAFPEVGFLAKPIKGSAVYFEYQNADGQLDYRCLHAGMPVRRGDKWIMTKWLRERAYEQ